VTDIPRISVVDDDEAVRDALGELVAALGYFVRTFESAKDFIENKGPQDIACVITDVQMPGMTGLDLIDHLRRNAILIPVILVSAHKQPALQSRAHRSGAVAWLEKPIRHEELAESITRAMAQISGRISFPHSRCLD
jgi:FixJ family two-component response regulator